MKRSREKRLNVSCLMQADVFLEQRSLHDMERNAMVAVL